MSKKYWILSLLLSVMVMGGASCLSFGGSGTSGPAGMFVSANRGDDWKQVSVMPTVDGNKDLSGISVYRLLPDPQDPNAIYWASRNKGLFYSYDAGKSWNHASGELSEGFVYSMAVHPEDKCTLFATNGRQVFKTIDCSRNWTEIFREGDASVSLRELTIDYTAPYSVLLGKSDGSLLRSVDDGESWAQIKNFGNTIADIQFDRYRPGLVYVATKKKGLFRSEDNGGTWISLADKLDEFTGGLDFRRLYVYPSEPNQIYWVSKYGVFTSRNAGEDWDAYELVTPPGSVNIYAFTVNPKNENEIFYTATDKSNIRSTFYRSLDGGKTWVTKKLPTGQLPTALYAHPDHDGRLYIGFTIPPED